MNYDEAFAERMKQTYPPGTRIYLISMEDPYQPVPPGTRGTVLFVDDIGTIHPKWDNGSSLGVVPGEDLFRKLTQAELEEEKMMKYETYTKSVEYDIIPNIDFKKLSEAYDNSVKYDDSYIKEIMKELHERFVEIYGTDTVTEDDGYLAVPAIVESEQTGDIYPAILGIDFSSAGEHWKTMLITPDGVRKQNCDENTAEENEFFEKICPYKYWYTVGFTNDIHVDLDECTYDILSILVECNENLYYQTGGMNLC